MNATLYFDNEKIYLTKLVYSTLGNHVPNEQPHHVLIPFCGMSGWNSSYDIIPLGHNEKYGNMGENKLRSYE